MTITSTVVSVTYAGDGGSTAFAVPFPFFGPDEIAVYERTIATGVQVALVRGTSFTVSGGAGSTGTVTAVTAPPATVRWIIRRATVRTQQVYYTNYDPFPAASHEGALDRLTAQSQETDEAVSRTVRGPVGDGTLAVLPPAAQRANQVAAYDSTGQPIVGQPASAIVSAAMQPVVNSASLAAARAALGVNGPAASVSLGGTNQNGIASGVYSKVAFWSKDYDTTNAFNSSTSRWTPGIIGIARISTRVSFVSLAAATAIFVSILKNGFYYRLNVAYSGGTEGANGAGIQLSVDVQVTATTDYFEIFASQTSGATQNILGTALTTWATFAMVQS